MKTECLNEAEIEPSASDDLANEILQKLNVHLLIPRLTLWGDRYDSPTQIGKRINVRRVFRARSYNRDTTPWQPVIDNRVDMQVNIESKFGIDFCHKDPVVGGRKLASLYDIAGGKAFHNGTHYQVGVAGSDLTVDAIDKMVFYIREQRMDYPLPALLHPDDFAAIAGDIDQHGAPPIADEFVRERYRGRCREVYLYETDDLPYYEIADYGASAPLVDSPGGYRGSKLPTDGWQASTKVLNKGQLITIADVYDVKPRDDYQQLAELKTFLVTADVNSDASGRAEILIYPEINAGELTTDSSTGAYRTCSDNAADNAGIVIVGAGKAGANKGKKLRQGFIFGKRAMQYVNIQMRKSTLGDIEQGYATDQQTGLGVLYSAKADFYTLKDQTRVNVCGAVKVVHPELVVRVITGEV